MSVIWDALKKKGFKVNVLKIPTRRLPVQIEHHIHEEMNRAKVIHTLNRVQEFLSVYHESTIAQQLTEEITSLIQELKSYKK